MKKAFIISLSVIMVAAMCTPAFALVGTPEAISPKTPEITMQTTNETIEMVVEKVRPLASETIVDSSTVATENVTDATITTSATGRGYYYVDEDGDGVCDNYGTNNCGGNGTGICDGTGANRQGGKGGYSNQGGNRQNVSDRICDGTGRANNHGGHAGNGRHC